MGFCIMSFFSNAVRLIRRRKDDKNVDLQNTTLEIDFAERNYVKESFTVLIRRPLSRVMLKIIKVTALVITGCLGGIAAAVVALAILMQFGSMENTMISGFIASKIEQLFPDADFSTKSASIRWNTAAKTFEINMKKVHLNDFIIPNISIVPDYAESFKQQTLVVKTLSVIGPKINARIGDDWKRIAINPNMIKTDKQTTYFEPLPSLGNFASIFGKNSVIKLINANIVAIEDGVTWNFNNVYCESIVGENFPRVLEGTTYLPGQKAISKVSITKDNVASSGANNVYDIRLESVNPDAVIAALSRRSVPVDSRILTAIDGYNLPVSGSMKLCFAGSKFTGGEFALNSTGGSIKLPVKSTFSLNLGKRIDSGEIYGKFSDDGAIIDTIKIAYGNSGFQLTGMSVPLSNFRFLDMVNLDGTLSLTNINVQEMESLLPGNIVKSAITMFKNYLPGFRLELFNVDLRGPVAFGNRSTEAPIKVGQGFFKVKNAKIPLGNHVVHNIDAVGHIVDDGLDIKLIGATFNNTKINGGMFHISNRDNSWIGKVNVDVPLNDITGYTAGLSRKLSSMPLGNLGIKGTANLDMQLVRVEGDEIANGNLPFRIVQGEGTIASDNNTKELRLAWDAKSLRANGDVSTGDSKIHMQLQEDLLANSGTCSMNFASNSEFLKCFIPGLEKICSGDFDLKIDTKWKGAAEEHAVVMNLKNATMVLPLVGDVKSKADNGSFTALVKKNGEEFDFTNMQLNTKNNKIIGSMTLDKNGKLIRSAFPTFNVGGCSAKVNMLHNEAGKMYFSAVGDSIDLSKIQSIMSNIDRDNMLSIYVNVSEMLISDSHRVRNVKGTVDLKNGRLVNGNCIGVIGESTTLALSTQEIAGVDDTLITLSASDAGEFLKFFKIMEAVNGGTLNIVTKSSQAGGSLSGTFEMNDFIVQDNHQLSKIISLSSVNWLPSSSFAVGFNSCVGNFVVSGDKISIASGVAVSPSMGISFQGAYDRLNDDLRITGVSLPMSSLLNNQGHDGALVSDYQVDGSLGQPHVSVKPLRLVGYDDLQVIFGNTIPLIMTHSNNMHPQNRSIAPYGSPSDVFEQRAFDRPAEVAQEESMDDSNSIPPMQINQKHGVKIRRGIGR